MLFQVSSSFHLAGAALPAHCRCRELEPVVWGSLYLACIAGPANKSYCLGYVAGATEMMNFAFAADFANPSHARDAPQREAGGRYSLPHEGHRRRVHAGVYELRGKASRNVEQASHTRAEIFFAPPPEPACHPSRCGLAAAPLYRCTLLRKTKPLARPAAPRAPGCFCVDQPEAGRRQDGEPRSVETCAWTSLARMSALVDSK
jgi:hypothetical protein